MATHQQAAIRHLAGRIAAETVWPNPDLTHQPEKWAAHLLHLVTTPPTTIGLPALAAAGPLITTIRGHHPNVDHAAAAINTDAYTPDTQHGHDIGIGFCRSVFNTDTIDRAITFLISVLDDPDLTPERRNHIFLSAIGSILTIYATAW